MYFLMASTFIMLLGALAWPDHRHYHVAIKAGWAVMAVWGAVLLITSTTTGGL